MVRGGGGGGVKIQIKQFLQQNSKMRRKIMLCKYLNAITLES